MTPARSINPSLDSRDRMNSFIRNTRDFTTLDVVVEGMRIDGPFSFFACFSQAKALLRDARTSGWINRRNGVWART